MIMILACLLALSGALAAGEVNATAGDAHDAIKAAMGKDVVVSVSGAGVAATLQFKANATAQEKATAQSVIDNFDWTKKPTTQNDIDKNTLRTLAVKDPKTWTADEVAAFRSAVCRLLAQ